MNISKMKFATALGLALAAVFSHAKTLVEVTTDRTITAEEEIAADTVFDVKSGVTLDMASRALTIAGVTGKGTIANAALTLTLAEGPYRFDGTMAGTLTFSKTSAVSLDEFHFIVGAADTLQNVAYTEPNVDGCVLQFAPGVGKFLVKQITFASKQRLVLDDTNGDPITVTSKIIESSKGNVKLSGSGDYVNTDRLGGGGLNYNIFVNKTGGRFIEGNGSFDLAGTASSLAALEGVGVDTSDTSGTIYLKNSNSAYLDFPCNLYWFKNGSLEFNFPTTLQAKQIRNYLRTSSLWVTGNTTISNGVFFTQGGGRTLAIKSTTTLTLDNAAAMSYDGSRYLFPGKVRYDGASGYGGLTLVLTNGSAYGMTDAYPVRTTVTTGSTFLPAGGSHAGTVETPTVIAVDGGAVGVALSVDSQSSASMLDTAKVEVQVGALGAKIVGETYDALRQTAAYVKGPVRTADGIAKDGGVTMVGGATWQFSVPLGISGPFNFREGFITVPNDVPATEGTTYFGTGDFVFGTGVLVNESTVNPFPLANGAGAKLVVDGAADLRVKKDQHFNIGPSGAASSSLVRSAGLGGVLILRTAGNIKADGSGSKVMVAGGVEKAASGLPKVPVVKYDRASESTYFGTLGFLDYDAANGFVPFAGETVGLGGGADSVAKLEGAATVSADTHVAALNQGWNPVTINEGATLKLGNGTDPAAVLFATAKTSYGDYIATIKGAGTLDFGTSEGVFLVPAPVGRTAHPTVSARIAGSAGVSYNGVYAGTDNGSWEAIYVNGDNVYTGGTRLSGIAAYAGTPTAFGKGTVTVDGGTLRGGRLILNAEGLAISNDVVVSGLGGPHYNGMGSTRPGAISFAYSSTLAGNVTVVDSAAFGTYEVLPEASYHEGILDGIVSGGTVKILAGSGSIVMTRANTYTGRTVLYGKLILRGSAARAGTKDIVMMSGSVLRIENDEPVTVPNRIIGKGTIELAGTAPVTFGDASAFCGNVDLCGGSRTVSELGEGVAEVVSTGATAPCLLTVANASTRLKATLGANVSVAPGAGGVLNLDGTARTVSAVGGSGRIFGAPLTVTGEIQPGGEGAIGTLTLAGPVTLGNDAKLVAEVGADGIDNLVIDGDFSLAGLPLEIRRISQYPTLFENIVETTGTLTGYFESVDKPKRGIYELTDVIDNRCVKLRATRRGMIITIR